MTMAFCALMWSTAKATESEPNNTKAQANTLTLNGSNSGAISPAADQDWWQVSTTADGKLDVSLTISSGIYTWIYLYDNDGTTLLNSSYSNSSFTVTTDGLAAGTYYVKVVGFYDNQTTPYSISNTLTMPTQTNDVEPNGTRAQAKILGVNKTTTGHVNYYYNNLRDSSDWYKITTNPGWKT
jgi:hypothetical protein